MSAQHTPGPWEIDFGYNRIINFIGPCVPDQYAGSAWLEVTEADARLIAAAPDLLEALQSVWLWMEDQADGQSKGGHATFDLMLLREQRDIARAAIEAAHGIGGEA